jgi:nicotinate-nucleotide pyrophosphorylase (carboxylating)
MSEMRSKYADYLREDIGSGDVTTDLLVPPDSRAVGRVVAKESCILAGAKEAEGVFAELGATVERKADEGKPVAKGDVVLIVKGPTRALLSGERLALNFLMRMSGIATLTNDLLSRCRKANPAVRIAATRKTTP